jgi:type II secretory pathway pseudopilin PulG
MNKVNYLALGAVALTIISIFSPWLEVSDTANASGLTESFQPVIISGISIGYGIFGLLVALLGGFLVFKEYKWTVVAGIVNFIIGYGYLHQWFGAGSHDSGNYGDVTSKSSVDPKFGIYLFIIASLAFIIFTLKYYKSKKNETVIPSEPDIKENQHPLFTIKNTTTSQVYQPSKIQTMTTSSTENPNEPASTGKPKATETTSDTSTDLPVVTLTASEPAVPVQPTEAPKAPTQAIVNEPTPVYQSPVTATPQPPYVEPEKKKSSTTWILLIILGIVLAGAAVFFMTNTTSQKSKDKTEQSVNDEKARLDVIINEVNQDVSDKKYDDALLKINSINWLYDPSSNKGYVDQYNSQRENLRNTIEQLKTNKDLDDQKQAAEKANQATPPPVQTSDSIH